MLKLSYPSCEIRKGIDAPHQAVWDFITDTNRWPEWGPSVVAVECEDHHIKKGSWGRVRIPFGIWVPFVITDYDDGRYWAWKIWGVRATGHRIESIDDHGCRLIFEVPSFAAPYLFICWIAIKRIATLVKHTL